MGRPVDGAPADHHRLHAAYFHAPDISFGFGIPLQFDISWFAEELKLYNALVVCLCVTYTFVQGGHVRVDLVYSASKFRTKKVIDMFGRSLS